MSIRTSPQTEQLDEAFAKAQAKFEAAVKATEGQIATRRYKYADVSSIIDATLEHLNSAGIVLRQHPSLEWRRLGEECESMTPFVVVTTRLSYKGQWEESDISIPAHQRGNFDSQSIGSALTYACRYALQGILVVRRADDDDGAAAAGRGTHEEAQAVGKKKVAELKEQLEASLKEASLFYIWYEASNTAEITGHRGLMKSQEDLLKPLKQGGKLVANLDQLEALKVRFEERGVPFSALKAM